MKYGVRGTTITGIAIQLTQLVVLESGQTLGTYTPTSTDTIVVNLVGSKIFKFTPTYEDNMLYIGEWTPSINGAYAVEVLITQQSGMHLRSMKREQFCIVESAEDIPNDGELINDTTVVNMDTFVFVQGEQGEQGEQGVQGIQGKSAYDVAVDNGYEGTQAEWLETLKAYTFDTTPTDGSTNPVTSGGVYPLSLKVTEMYGGEDVLTPYEIRTGKAVSNGASSTTDTGYWISAAAYNTYIFNVEDYVGDSLAIVRSNYTVGYHWIFCTSYDFPQGSAGYAEDPTAWTSNLVSAKSARGTTSGNLYEQNLTIPEGSVYMLIVGTSSITPSAAKVYEGIVTPVNEMQAAFEDNVITDITAYNLTARGVYVNNQDPPSIGSSSNYRLSDPILLHQGEKITFEACVPANKMSIMWKVDSSVPITSTSDERNFTKIVESNPKGGTSRYYYREYVADEDCYVVLQSYTGRYRNFSITSYGLYSKSEQIDELPSIKNRISSLEDGLYLTDYDQEERDRILSYIRPIAHHDLFVFAMNTDQHINDGSANSKAVFRGLNSMRSLAENFPFDMLVCGGDEPGYSSQNTIEIIAKDVNQIMRESYTPTSNCIYLAGNHDAFQNLSETPSGMYMYNLKQKRNLLVHDFASNSTMSTNGYLDFEQKKIRVLFVDQLSSAGTECSDNASWALSDANLISDGWKLIVVSHAAIPSDTYGTTGYPSDAVYSMITAKANDGLNVVSFHNGHIHKTTQDMKDNILFLNTGSAGSASIAASFDGVTYKKNYGTSEETHFDVFAYDFTDMKLYAFSFGTEPDRQYNITSGNKGIELCNLSGVVSSSSTVDGGTITASYHNVEYSVTLDSTGAYNFPYLCPNRDVTISVSLSGGETSEETITTSVGNVTKNISL